MKLVTVETAPQVFRYDATARTYFARWLRACLREAPPGSYLAVPPTRVRWVQRVAAVRRPDVAIVSTGVW